ncbi:hypothetical protein CCACVL1_14434 [Corchorus capsularis]|uniref:Uncharacterized protein n=1 Tax=Corchorus capsularis TaxID=210143 RepID=A0A1R3I744_COCAP|nr:hypothetical protein CCACVL1_14434 [Corchorus capsularis]
MHNDGTEVNLLCASGCVHVAASASAPPIPLVIWVHENYPQNPPLVFVSLDPVNPIHRHHPFVDTSGVTSPPYILTWKFPSCNLSGLLRNLVQLFSYDHPFSDSPPSPPPPCSGFSHPSFVSKKEALDRLVGMVYYDMAALQESTAKEIEELSLSQEKLKSRDVFITNMISEMEEERAKLKERAYNWAEEADRLVNWLKVNDGRPGMALDAGEVEIEGAFEMDEKSNLRLDCSAADLAIDDVLYKLDKALELEAVSFDLYLKQVRILAREQFFLRARELKLDGMNILPLSPN